jgi:hypothetical protein
MLGERRRCMLKKEEEDEIKVRYDERKNDYE